MENETGEIKKIKIKYKTVMKTIIVIEVLIILGAILYGIAM